MSYAHGGGGVNLQERLQSLLMEAEQHVPGSQQRTHSLEQIRSILLDRGTTLKNASSPKSISSLGDIGISPVGGGHSHLPLRGSHVLSPSEHDLLGDGMLHEGHSSLHSIPEVGVHHGQLWSEAGFPDEHAVHEGFDAPMGGNFMMDDVDAPTHQTVPTRAPPASTPAGGVGATRPPVHPPAPHAAQTVSAPSPAPPAAAPAGGAAAYTAPGGSGVRGGAAGKPPASPAKGGGKVGSKGGGQMSSLAREEQALIPHLPAAGGGGGAPVVPMQLEPDKRLSHKEVEQRRREKAKQYFDELRALLPFGSDSAKFDKNAILHHSIILLKQLMQELAQEEAASTIKAQPEQAGLADFRCCFDVSRQPMCFAGLDSRLSDANSAFCSLSGYTRMEVTGISFLNSTAPADSEVATQQWQLLLAPGCKQTSTSYRCRIVRKDGQQMMCNVDLALCVRQGKPHSFLVSVNPCV